MGASGGYAHGGGVSAHAAAALHTPMTPQQYHRPPRPHLGELPNDITYSIFYYRH